MTDYLLRKINASQNGALNEVDVTVDSGLASTVTLGETLSFSERAGEFFAQSEPQHYVNILENSNLTSTASKESIVIFGDVLVSLRVFNLPGNGTTLKAWLDFKDVTTGETLSKSFDIINLNASTDTIYTAVKPAYNSDGSKAVIALMTNLGDRAFPLVITSGASISAYTVNGTVIGSLASIDMASANCLTSGGTDLGRYKVGAGFMADNNIVMFGQDNATTAFRLFDSVGSTLSTVQTLAISSGGVYRYGRDSFMETPSNNIVIPTGDETLQVVTITGTTFAAGAVTGIDHDGINASGSLFANLGGTYVFVSCNGLGNPTFNKFTLGASDATITITTTGTSISDILLGANEVLPMLLDDNSILFTETNGAGSSSAYVKVNPTTSEYYGMNGDGGDLEGVSATISLSLHTGSRIFLDSNGIKYGTIQTQNPSTRELKGVASFGFVDSALKILGHSRLSKFVGEVGVVKQIAGTTVTLNSSSLGTYTEVEGTVGGNLDPTSECELTTTVMFKAYTKKKVPKFISQLYTDYSTFLTSSPYYGWPSSNMNMEFVNDNGAVFSFSLAQDSEVTISLLLDGGGSTSLNSMISIDGYTILMGSIGQEERTVFSKVYGDYNRTLVFEVNGSGTGYVIAEEI